MKHWLCLGRGIIKKFHLRYLQNWRYIMKQYVQIIELCYKNGRSIENIHRKLFMKAYKHH